MGGGGLAEVRDEVAADAEGQMGGGRFEKASKLQDGAEEWARPKVPE